MDDFFVELEYGHRSGDSDAGELSVFVKKVMMMMDAYLSLAPAADVEQASANLLHRLYDTLVVSSKAIDHSLLDRSI